MKLTIKIRDAFVRDVMADVPNVDYREKAQKILDAYAFEEAHPLIKKVLEDNDLKPLLAVKSYYIEGFNLAMCGVYAITDTSINEALKKLHLANKSLNETRNALRNKLYAVIAGCTTLKQAQDRLPEFAKYLPVENVTLPNLPTVTGLLSDLTKAGWPKS